MLLLPASIVNDIKTNVLELGLMDPKENNPLLDQKIQSYAVLLFRMIKDVEKIPAEETYRVVEFGCGTNLFMFCMVNAIARLKHKKILYVGIDTDEEAIGQLNQSMPDRLRASCRFIQADGSDVLWMEKTGNPKVKFHTAIFINPIVEDPDIASQESDKEFGIIPNARMLASRAKYGPKLRQQYKQFTIIFNEVLKRCLEPSGSVLIRTWYRREYGAVLKTLSSLVEDLPKTDQAIPNHNCIAATFRV